MSDTSLVPIPTNALPDAGNVLVVQSGEIELEREFTELWMPGGQVIRFPTSLLRAAPQASGADASGALLLTDEPGDVTIPLIEEKLVVNKRTVPTAKIRLQKSIQTYEETLDEPLLVRTFDVDRVLRNEPINAVPPVRQEGETTIYPLVEERMVLTKQLILREEVRVTRREAERRDTRTIVLRREQIDVEREEVLDASAQSTTIDSTAPST